MHSKDARCVLLSSNVQGIFCAGADLKVDLLPVTHPQLCSLSAVCKFIQDGKIAASLLAVADCLSLVRLRHSHMM